ncbi:MAG: family 43 glycosylhydrolase [Dysgonomonas mossii]|uniref:glycoside hydrolase family 43 protein n=1 Tax=Dysgonomonas mossii TaxID=163665 RepID=UPI001D1F0B9B|nr:glycoside hydrolase family 43 protein [Dysgonomonas mossii]MBS5797713.1 family 43 glycosylhydrolase [Dysgonomonas mossii]MBS7112277.1 family 43 glycosylhydrolase [Dysgonomonas mossii]
MKKTIYTITIAALILFLACSTKSVTNKHFTPGAIWLDNNNIHINAHGGGILFDNGVYYWFGEHKTEGENGNLANVGVHCYSSTDLYDWTDEGIALAVMPSSSGSDIEEGCILERPKVIKNKKTGKYIMWFHLEPKGKGYKGALSGVAISDNVTGPYTYIKAVRPNAGHYPLNVLDIHKLDSPALNLSFDGGSLPGNVDTLNILGRDMKEGQMARDMTLFVDDDGKAYHIYSSEENSTLHIAELSDDYLSHTGKYGRFFAGRFMEAPAMFKHKGKYYLMMSGCTGWNPNQARSAVSDNIFGEWKEFGDPCIGDTTQTTFHSQSTYILPVQGKPDTYIYMGDRWNPKNAIDGRYIWLPITFDGDRFTIRWNDKWKIEE